METIDLFFRFAAIGVLGVLAGLPLAELHGRLVGALGALLGLCVGCYLVVSAPVLDQALGGFRYPLIVGAVAAPVLFFVFSRALFDDEFRLRPWHFIALATIEALAFSRLLAIGDASTVAGVALGVTHAAIELALVALALVLAWLGRRSDLIEARRRFRLVLVAAIGAYIVVIAAVEIGLGGADAPDALGVANAGGILLISLAIARGILSVRNDLLVPAPARHATPVIAFDRGQDPPVPDEARSAPDAYDQALADAVQRAMTDARLYRQPGLTIASLAKHLGTQEHRLRRTINQGLGYRNFAAFLNHYRLAEVCAALKDPAKARLPILTISMDAGYGSLGPFNQAFKQATGLTPTEFRRGHGVHTPGEPPAPD